MVQFNLLPAVKLEYIKARRVKRLVIASSVIASALALSIFLIMIVTVNVLQKNNLKDLNDDIGTYSRQLKAVPDLDKILTVQNQLTTLTDLHDKKPAVSRLFTYIGQVTPASASLTQLNLDFTASTITLGGTAPSLDTVSTFTDTLKSTTYVTAETGSQSTAAFKDVVLSSFSRSSDNTSFTITLSFDPILFDSTKNVTLNVPSGSTAAQNTFKVGA